jgi:hypothetical protein
MLGQPVRSQPGGVVIRCAAAIAIAAAHTVMPGSSPMYTDGGPSNCRSLSFDEAASACTSREDTPSSRRENTYGPSSRMHYWEGGTLEACTSCEVLAAIRRRAGEQISRMYDGLKPKPRFVHMLPRRTLYASTIIITQDRTLSTSFSAVHLSGFRHHRAGTFHRSTEIRSMKS